MNILLTFTGFHDPFAPTLVEGEETPGPILTLAASRPFDHIFLFSTPNAKNNTAGTADALGVRNPTSRVEVINLSLPDPTNYSQIFGGLRKSFQKITSQFVNAHYFIGISSGTPQMHACWLLLAASGEIPARILMTRPPRFVTGEAPLVQEVDFTQSSFPLVRSLPEYTPSHGTDIPDVATALRELNIVGDDRKVRQAIDEIARYAPTDLPVLILGETGTGKELFARLVHHLSGRTGSFIAINCAAIPKDLAESTLFGHVKGSFTGAVNDQKGELVKANEGTLFLDELGELPAEVQAKLLRVLEEKKVQPVGAKSPVPINIRIVAATNRDLEKDIEKEKFREDLYYRLNTATVVLPPLRERRGDIPKIALNILDAENLRAKRQRRLTPEALRRLQAHSWPGNVRDLHGVISRSVLLSQNEVLAPEDLLITEVRRSKDPFTALPEPAEGFAVEDFLGKIRKHFFLRALSLANNNQSEAARLLGVSPQAVNKFMKSGSGES